MIMNGIPFSDIYYHSRFLLAWLRNHCMEIFHYCSEVLKGTPLFQSCSDAEAFALKRTESREGAVYNDYDGIAEDLMHESDFEEQLHYASSSSGHESEEATMSFSQQEMDEYFLGADENDPKRWHKDHPLFTTEITEVDSVVNKLMKLSENEWKNLINREDIQR